jgi:hypothetical protein
LKNPRRKRRNPLKVYLSSSSEEESESERRGTCFPKEII